MTEKTKEDRWGLYNYETGEITPVDRMDTKPMRWEKSYGRPWQICWMRAGTTGLE
jgi:hypothetical protein